MIKNIDKIDDELELDFSKGLNIITGETGAGKSILINAIDIAFGAKCGKEVIKTNCDKAIIELSIDLTKLNPEHKLYFDNRMPNALFSLEPIPNKAIEIIKDKNR